MNDGATVTDLILAVFRLNGQLLAAGDDLVRDLGLTSARWQVLGAVAMAPQPLPVAGIARLMGLSRQAVQRVVDELSEDGLLAFAPNPHHQRAKLVVLTERGRETYAAAAARQAPWASRLAEGLAAVDLAVALRVLDRVEARLAAGADTPAR